MDNFIEGVATTTWSMIQMAGRVGRKDEEQAVFVTVAETSSNSRGTGLFLAALSSSRSLVVGPLVCPSVGPLMFVKKLPLEYQRVIKTYLPTYL